MRRLTIRLVVGIAAVLLVTALLAGVVATAAAITIELSDGDACETGGEADVRATATPENVTALAGNATRCLGVVDDPGASDGQLPDG